MLDVELHGLDAGGFLLTNLLLHALASALLFLALSKLTGELPCSAFTAAVFAVHPLHVESVAWVSARKDVLSGLFFMLALLAYPTTVRRHIAWAARAALFACLALGLLAKPMLVTLPFVLLLLDGWPLGRLTAPGGGLDAARILRAAAREAAALRPGRSLLSDHAARAVGRRDGRVARACRALRPRGERAGRLSRLPAQVRMAERSGGVLSALRGGARALEAAPGRGAAARHHGVGAARGPAARLPRRRLALVPRHAGPDPRSGAGRLPGARRSLHVPAARRARARARLGSGGRGGHAGSPRCPARGRRAAGGGGRSRA